MIISLSEAANQLPLNEVHALAEIPTVFCDCDGVLADFYGTCRSLLNLKENQDVEDFLNHPSGWEKIKVLHPDLFAKLDLLPDAKALMEELTSLRDNQLIRLNVLTALPNSWMADPTIKDSAIMNKKQWVSKNFPSIQESAVIVCNRKDKAAFGMADKQFYNTDPILIDDYNKNVVEWVSHTRGYAIEHKDTESTLKQLKVYLKGLRVGELMADIYNGKLAVEMIAKDPQGTLEIPIQLTLEADDKKPKKKEKKPETPPKKAPIGPDQKVVGIDHKGDEILSNKRIIAKGKGDDPANDYNNQNKDDGPVPATLEPAKDKIVMHPPVNMRNVVAKDKTGLNKV